jgi:predicted MPP superfamily phosphohydrolase
MKFHLLTLIFILKKLKSKFWSIQIHVFLILALCISNIHLFSQPKETYSFIVAGHTYGAHTGTNIGLYPKFLTSLDAGFDTSTRFMVFTGDLVNKSTAESWAQVEQELNKYELPCYYVMGNHDGDAAGISVFESKFGNTYYSFDFNNDRFIILNSTEKDRSISDNQLEFLKETVESADDSIHKVFIFFHELLWNSLEKYKGVLSNSRSRYDQIKAYSNYWDEVHPLLELYPDKKFYVFAGDVGGNTDAIATFYDKWNNITLLASGMGEVADENYLVATVMEDGTVDFKLVPLNTGVTLNTIEFYSVPEQPLFLLADTAISPNISYEYSVTEIKNADSYIWELPEHANGTSTTNSIQVSFDVSFTSGTISVIASSQFFGSSAPASKIVSLNETSILKEKADRLKIHVYRNTQYSILEVFSEIADDLQIDIYGIDGRKFYSNKIRINRGMKKQIELLLLSRNIYIVSASGKMGKKVEKVMVW